MLINTKQALIDMKGGGLKADDTVLTVGEALSNIMIMSKSGGKMKTFILAKRFIRDEKLDLDKSDFNLVKSACEVDESYQGSIVTGQLLVILNDIKEEPLKD